MTAKILLVDNVAGYRKEIAVQLRARDYEVYEASNSDEAIDTIRDWNFALAVVDNDLPGLSGANLLHLIRESDQHIKLMLIADSSYDLDSDFENNFYEQYRLVKGPLSPKELIIEIETYLIGHSAYSCLSDPPIDPHDLQLGSNPNKSPYSLSAPSIDSAIKKIKNEYRDRLPHELKNLKEALTLAHQELSLETFNKAHTLAHTLRGTSGTLGFSEVSDITSFIDDEIKDFIAGQNPSPERWKKIWEEFRRAETIPDRLSLVVSVEPHTDNVATVLFADSNRESVRQTVLLGHNRCIDVKPAVNREQVLDWAAACTLDGAIMDLSCMHEGHIINCIEILREMPGLENIPIALMSVDCSIENRVAAAHAGATHFLKKPVSGDDLVEVVQHFLIEKAQNRYRVLVIDDDEPFREHVAAILRQEGFYADTLDNPKEILERADLVKPDVMLLDVLMPEISGFDVCRMLRSTTQWKEVPILFLTAEADPKMRLECFRAGGDDYIQKPVLKEELLARIGVRLERIRLYKERADKDALTALPSRRAFIEMFKVRIAEGLRYNLPVTLCLLDIDRFKYVNDTYGHLTGDRVLAGLGKLLKNRFRAMDIRGRWGGEEFTVVFHGENKYAAKMILSRLLDEFRSIEFEGERKERFHCTFSSGIAELRLDGYTADELFRIADERLYSAKKEGRNRIVIE